MEFNYIPTANKSKITKSNSPNKIINYITQCSISNTESMICSSYGVDAGQFPWAHCPVCYQLMQSQATNGSFATPGAGAYAGERRQYQDAGNVQRWNMAVMNRSPSAWPPRQPLPRWGPASWPSHYDGSIGWRRF